MCSGHSRTQRATLASALLRLRYCVGRHEQASLKRLHMTFFALRHVGTPELVATRMSVGMGKRLRRSVTFFECV